MAGTLQPTIIGDSENRRPTPEPSFTASLQQYAFSETANHSPSFRVTRSSASKLITPSPTSSILKRKAPPYRRESSTIATTTHTTPSPGKKQKRPSSSYAPSNKYAHLPNLLTDSLSQNLICVFIGVNPGIRTAATGHAYSHPSNLFWKLCHTSGCTPRLCKPSECHDLPSLYALGNTNIVSRATKDASQLSKAEMDEGVAVLEEKIRTYRPESVSIVGKSIWEAIWRVRHKKKISKEEFRYGWQEERERMGVVAGERGWEGARVFVATTTSGLAVGMMLDEKEEVWRGLGSWVEGRRRERGIPDGGRIKPMVEEEVVEVVEDR